MSHILEFDRAGSLLRAKDAGKNVLLGSQRVQHAFLDGVFGDQVDDLHRGELAVTVGAGNTLFEHGGIPGQVEVDDQAGSLQVQSDAARIGGKKDAAGGIVEEFLDEIAAFGGGHVAGQLDVAQADALDDGFGEGQHVGPLAEHDGFMAVGGDFLGQDFSQLTQFGAGLLAVFGQDFLVVQGQGVADEAHFDQAHQQDFALFGGERHALGFSDKLGKVLAEFVVSLPLRVGHFDEEVVVGARRQVFEHFAAGAAQHVRGDEGAQLVKVFVAEHFVCAAVALFQFVEAVVEVPERAEDARVEKLKDAVEFVYAVFERRAGEDEGIAAGQGLDHLCGLGAPVLDALGFVEDDEVGAQLK